MYFVRIALKRFRFSVMKYSVLHLYLLYSFVAVCSAKEIEIGAVLQLDKDAIQKIAAVLQKPDNETNPDKQYVDYLKEVIEIMKSYDADKLGEMFHIITDNVRKMLEKENITNTDIFKDLSKVKYEIRDQIRRKLLDETLKALEDKSDVGTRRQKLIEQTSKDFKKEDIASFITYLNMFKHDTKRTNTKSHGFKKAMNRIIKATMVILKCLKEDASQTKRQKVTKKKSHKQYFPADVSTFDDKFEYDNQDEGLKMKLDHDYFVMDRLWDELAHNSGKKSLRTPTPSPTDVDETTTIAPAQNEDIFETEFDTTTPQLKHKRIEQDVLADFDIEVKKTKNQESAKNREIVDGEKDVKNKEEPSELLRQLYPPTKKVRNVKILRQDMEKPEIQNHPNKEKLLLDLIREEAKTQKIPDDKKGSEMLRQRLPPEILDMNVKVRKKHKSKKKTTDDYEKMLPDLSRAKVKRQKIADYEKSSEYIKGRVKKQKKIKIKDSLELLRDKMQPDIDKKKDLSELPRVKHRGKTKKQRNAEVEKTSTELLSQLFPPEMKIMNVKILKQENGIPQEIHLEHDALIDVRNFPKQSQNNAPFN